MRIKGVDFPTQLLEALEQGSLVIFAGAGVSIPPPSNFPNFDSLAEQVAAGVLVREQYGEEQREAVDHFLGRVKDVGIKVHDRVHQILSDVTSTPNVLHATLLRLFKNPSDLRLVTTNFDLHFVNAATNTFTTGNLPEIYYAPALPVGDSFTGIVHLHGSVSKSPNRMVLTDSDFGSAYLTDGWATRFLQRLFSHNVVMFVGYSHNDVVIDYLARGLPPKSPGRFALAPAGSEAHWKRLGIIPVTYPLGAGDQKHAALALALQDWADLIWTPTLDHEEKIRSIVERPVTLDPEELDYLVERVCKEPTLAQFFTRHAKTPDWLRWAESKGLLSSLFKHTGNFGELDQLLALWFSQNFVCNHPAEALAVVQRQGGFLSPLLWRQIGLALHRTKPSGDIAAKWLPLLTDSEPPNGGNELLDYRLCACEFPQDESSIMLLLEHLTRPRLRLTKEIRFSGDDKEGVDVELRLEGADYWLRHAWVNLLQPNLESLSDKILLMATSNIQRAYMLLRSHGKDRPTWDPLSGLRQQIEAAGQSSLNDAVAVLIDITRDTMQWTVRQRPPRADFFIDFWFSSGYRLLKRLAVFGVAEAGWDADRKMNWLLENDLLHAYGYKSEVFLVLQKSYAGATDNSRKKILERALQGSVSLDGNTKEYEIYNLVHWLVKSAPECPLTKQKLDDLITAHPDFGPREHPNLDWWTSGGWVSPTSPVQTEEILSSTPEQLLNDLASAKRNEFIGPSREGLLHKISDAVARQTDWSLNLARGLREKEVREADLWSAIVNGWKQTDLTDEQWKNILTIIDETDPLVTATVYEIAQFIESGVSKSSNAIPIDCFPLAMHVSKAVWNQCMAIHEENREHVDDWLFVAINRPAGTLVTFWLKTLSRLREQAGSSWSGLPVDHKEILLNVLTGRSYAATVGRVLIASQLFFLFGLDQGWAVQNVIPLFDFSQDAERATQAWHGYLGWGRWNDELLAYLMPHFEQTFSKVHSTFGKENRERFCEYLAAIACHSSIKPIESGWLNKFLRSVTDEERVLWASRVRAMLRAMKEPATESAWKSWIANYWRRRIEGIPVPLSVNEASQMVEWAVWFKVTFPEAASNVYRGPVPKLEYSILFEELSESDLLVLHPATVARFVFYLLKNRVLPLYSFDSVEKIVHRLRLSPDARNDLVEICQQLAELGNPSAGGLRALIIGDIQRGDQQDNDPT